VAEAYLTATTKSLADDTVSILALALDRFDIYRSAHGEEASQGVLARVAQAVRGLAATIGIIAAAYRNGTIVLVAPDCGAGAARQLGETLCNAVSRLHLPNSESIAADHVTASVAAVTGRVKRDIDRVHLLTQAISNLQDAAAAGGNRVLAVTI
jgi:GGDEF domain-containing protein